MSTLRFSDLSASVPETGLDPNPWLKSGQQIADDGQMERDFASMAYLFIQDRARALLPYMLGFEVVEVNASDARGKVSDEVARRAQGERA